MSENYQRRDFLRAAGAASAGGLVASGTDAADSPNNQSENDPSMSQSVSVELTINGRKQTHQIDSRTTLLDLLRENLRLTGTKKGCDHGACGACTVHIGEKRKLACLTLAATLDGAKVTTIEGLASGPNLHPLQESFLRCDAYQCGYCTPGQIMSGVSCIDEGHAAGSVEETREWMSGNLCRCSAYPNITAAVRQTAGSEPVSDPAESLVGGISMTPGTDDMESKS